MGHRGYSGNHPRFSRRQDERYDAKEAYNKDLTASARLHYLENNRHDHESPAKNVGMIQDRVLKARRLAADVDNYASDEIGFRDNPRFEQRLPGFAENTTAPGGLDYENMQARANHADWRNKMGYDATLQKEYVDDMKNYLEMDTPDTGFDNSMFVEESPMNRHNDKHIRREAKKIARKNKGDEQDIYYELKTQVDDERSRGAAEEGRKIGRFLSKNDERGGIDEASQEIMQEEVDRMLDERGGIDSPMNACAKSEGGSGCIKQMGGAWRVISNKTDKPWPAKYASKSKAEAALRGYHAG